MKYNTIWSAFRWRGGLIDLQLKCDRTPSPFIIIYFSLLIPFHSSPAPCDLTCLRRDISWEVSGLNALRVRGDFAIAPRDCLLLCLSRCRRRCSWYSSIVWHAAKAALWRFQCVKAEAPLSSAALYHHYILSAAAAAALVMCVCAASAFRTHTKKTHMPCKSRRQSGTIYNHVSTCRVVNAKPPACVFTTHPVCVTDQKLMFDFSNWNCCLVVWFGAVPFNVAVFSRVPGFHNKPTCERSSFIRWTKCSWSSSVLHLCS